MKVVKIGGGKTCYCVSRYVLVNPSLNNVKSRILYQFVCLVGFCYKQDDLKGALI